MDSLKRHHLPENFADLYLISRVALVMIEAIPVPIFCKTEDGRYLDGNQHFFDMIDLPREQVIGHTVFELYDPEKAAIYDAADQKLWKSGGMHEYEAPVDIKDGETSIVHFHKKIIEMEPGGERIMVGVTLDVTKLRETETRLQKVVRTDDLTGLHNRRAFMEHLEALCLRIRRHDLKFALLALDLDGFKAANDEYGHAAGDHILKVVSERFLKTVRQTDYVARIGGDEFMIVLEGAGDERTCRRVTDQIIKRIEEPIGLPWDGEVSVGVSIGVKICKGHGCDTDSLMLGADKALYGAKNAGKGQAFFDSEPGE